MILVVHAVFRFCFSVSVIVAAAKWFVHLSSKNLRTHFSLRSVRIVESPSSSHMQIMGFVKDVCVIFHALALVSSASLQNWPMLRDGQQAVGCAGVSSAFCKIFEELRNGFAETVRLQSSVLRIALLLEECFY